VVQVCTAAMHYGFRIVDDMVDGLGRWIRDKRYAGIDAFRGKAVPNVTDWQHLNLNYQIIAAIDQDLCIKCGLCHIACEDTAHRAIAAWRVGGERRYEVIDKECVGCNLCLHVCPVENCITMKRVDDGRAPLDWTQHPNNPLRKAAE
jgi:dihydropyrimidine dehydrogenase (NAD+) subunit PreA